MDMKDIAEQAYKNGYAQALADMAERLKGKAHNADYIRKDNHIDILDYFDDIDETVKELTK